MSDKDTRVFMYRGREGRLFNHPGEVPEGEGWKDQPHDLEEPAEDQPKRKKGKKADDAAPEAEPVAEPEANGDSN